MASNSQLLAAAISEITNNLTVTYEDYLLRRNQEPSNRFKELSIDALHQAYLVGGAVNCDETIRQSIVDVSQTDDDALTNSTTTPIVSPVASPASPPISNDPPVNIHIRTLTGAKITIYTPLSTSIAYFKQLVEQKTGVSSQQQRIIFAGRQLDDDRTLLSYKIEEDYSLHMVPRLSAAPQTINYIHADHLDPPYDFDFTNTDDTYRKFMRGAYEYKRPCGWKRIALKVLNAYGSDNSWLGSTSRGFRYESNAIEWPVSYHGTGKFEDTTISEDAYQACVDKNKQFDFAHGIYTTPDPDVAEKYAKVFEFESVKYKVLIQNRVNPNTLVRITKEESGVAEYWIVPNGQDVRPYGICVKKVS